MLSIIVPVYKVEKYIGKCLDSLVCLDIDKEIIIVNDGSPSNEEEIIKNYLDKYSFIKYFKKDNGGLSSARNYGLKNVNGDYVAFVDSDDFVDINYYKDLYNKAKDNDFDIVCGNVKLVYEDSSKFNIIRMNYKDNICVKDYMINNYPVVWNKVYKYDLVKDLLFKEGVWFEDIEYSMRLLLRVNKIGFLDNDKFYNYLQRNNSISNSVDVRLLNYIDNFNGLVDYYKENGYYDEYKSVLEYNYVRYIYATMIKRCKGFSYKEYLDIVDKAIFNVNSYFPNYRRNKLFYKSLKGIYLVLFSKILAKIYYRF